MKEMKRRKLAEMPMNKRFNGELCHSTGYEVLFDDGIWWVEYIHQDGTLEYGN